MIIRPIKNKDLSEIMELEKQTDEYQWNEEYFLGVIGCNNINGIVLEDRSGLLGYLVYQVNKKSILLLNLVIRKDDRRKGLASKLVERVKSWLGPERSLDCVYCVVREKYLESQLMLKKLEFKCTRILKYFFDDGQAGLLMQYCAPGFERFINIDKEEEE